jgi:glyoxylase-like metal-dependent hydrolase (beta-lactamase superfamily II)
MAKEVRDNGLILKILPLGIYQINGYLLICQETKESILIDPGDAPNEVLQACEGYTIKIILITHGHFDHVQALAQVKTVLNAPVAAHSLDQNRIPVPLDQTLTHNAVLNFGRLQGKVIHTPGHTPGSISLLVNKTLIAGDTLFPGGPGKTSSPEAFQQLIQTLEERIYTLPDDTIVYPGHGQETTVGESKKEYQIFCQKTHPKTLCGDVLWLTS